MRYMDVYRLGYPDYHQNHPAMELTRRAKIFSPFDALKGFSEQIAEKQRVREEWRELDQEQVDEINRKLAEAAGREVRIRYYDDGKYRELTGVIKKVRNEGILVGETWIGNDRLVCIDET